MTCKRLRERCEPLLYERVVLSSRGESYPCTRGDLLARTLQSREDLRPVVHTLVIPSTSHADQDVLSLCTHLRTLVAPDLAHALILASSSAPSIGGGMLQELVIFKQAEPTLLLPQVLVRLSSSLQSLRFRQGGESFYSLLIPSMCRAFSFASSPAFGGSLRKVEVSVPMNFRDCLSALVHSIAGKGSGVEELTIKSGCSFWRPADSEHSLTDSDLAESPLKILRLKDSGCCSRLGSASLASSGNRGWLGALGQQIRKLVSLRELHLVYDDDHGLDFSLPADAFGILPPEIELLVLSTRRNLSDDPSNNATLLPSLVAARGQQAPKEGRRIIAVEMRLKESGWEGLGALKTNCEAGGVEVRVVESGTYKNGLYDERIAVKWGLATAAYNITITSPPATPTTTTSDSPASAPIVTLSPDL